MTVLDSRIQPEAGPRPAGTDGQPVPAPMSRNPEDRLAALFDPGTVRLLTPHDDSGAVAACGQIDGMLAVAFASDPRVQGGARSTAGCMTSARATATRCCSPPESMPGRCVSRSASPTRRSNSSARGRASESGVRAMRIGISTFSSALNSGSRW